jgi:hypothetical protein
MLSLEFLHAGENFAKTMKYFPFVRTWKLNIISILIMDRKCIILYNLIIIIYN